MTELNTDEECSGVKATSQYIACCYENKVKLYEWGSWSVIATFDGGEDTFNCVDINPSNKILAAGCKGGWVYLWNLEELGIIPQKLIASQGAIKRFQFIGDMNAFCYCSERNELVLVEVPDFPPNFVASINSIQIKDIIYEKEHDYLFMTVKDDGLLVYSGEKLKFVSHFVNGYDCFASISDDKEKLVVLANLVSDKSFAILIYQTNGFDMTN